MIQRKNGHRIQKYYYQELAHPEAIVADCRDYQVLIWEEYWPVGQELPEQLAQARCAEIMKQTDEISV
jgi:hypothetical protein